MKLSEMQKEYWNESHKSRWGVKQGATRSGKTYLDYFLIVKRIRECQGQGQIVILGNTKSTIKRNIIEPMQEIWGNDLITNISNENTSLMFGKTVHCLGADKRNSVAKIQGMTIEYCYGDEITTWNEEMFAMLKSRLSCPSSHFDGTCNPDSPYHWLKEFLDSDADIYTQVYTIDDNPFLDETFVKELKKEYQGTVYYDRYILGLWALAEGLIYPMYADNPKKYELTYQKVLEMPISQICVGIDVGGTGSHTTFVATGIVGKFNSIIHLADDKLVHEKGVISPENIYEAFDNFLDKVEYLYPKFRLTYVFVDNAEQVIINGLRTYNRRNRQRNIVIDDCSKPPIEERIRVLVSLFNTERLKICDKCTLVQEAYSTMIRGEDGNLLDNGTTDVDTYNGAEYSWTKFIDYLIVRGGKK